MYAIYETANYFGPSSICYCDTDSIYIDLEPMLGPEHTLCIQNNAEERQISLQEHITHFIPRVE